MSEKSKFMTTTIRDIPRTLHNKVKLYRAQRTLDTMNQMSLANAYLELVEIGLSSKNKDDCKG